ncbi:MULTISPECIES: hypothetical protein [Carboxydocella]|uniref:Uncharacterized protein n=2 Tax=Carboxydocella TaxID=178898 RepID=A0A1T4LR28_9FIRM|nr:MULTISPECIES: hypothetical protein [Carboxydocella]AVX20573.1 hypothetical protein CFE_1384 [Carboxydocella thermautotrophica]AVX30995.1 hypothetical protein CTH_1405 [Carboxydocella thermautotrophica]GAW31500.1 hypothetical protein JDF658_12650 [Carboxydocella sp. JDF658]SJZ57192.1 hypothetical protein SAMN02745885_00263 [Carboxydocella sporoproducens DSM 16521]
MQELLFYSQLAVTALAIMWYIFAAFQGFKFLTGQMTTTEMVPSLKNLTMLGLLFSILSILFTGFYNLTTEKVFWENIMLVSIVDILFNAAVLHMLYWKWRPYWPAATTILTIFIDAFLRVMFTKFYL